MTARSQATGSLDAEIHHLNEMQVASANSSRDLGPKMDPAATMENFDHLIKMQKLQEHYRVKQAALN